MKQGRDKGNSMLSARQLPQKKIQSLEVDDNA
jgi:hypothetical protein